MQFSCKELIDIFTKVGGKMAFDYHTKMGTFYPQNISCKLPEKNDTAIILDKLCLEFQQDSYQYVSYLPTKSPVEKLHMYQDMSTGGIVFEFCRDKEGYINPIDINR
jgi:hypothetical protein